MSAEENKAIVLRLVDEVNRRGLAAFDEACAPGFVNHGTGGFPGLRDTRRTAQEALAVGDKVTLRFTGQAVHAPSGQEVAWETIHIYRMVDGKIAEYWGVMDRWSILEQLGLTPALPTEADPATR